MPPKRLYLLSSFFIILLLAACSDPEEPNISPLNPTALNFTGQVGQVVAQSGQITFQNTGNAALNYTALSTVAWLQVSAGGTGTLSPQQTATVIVRASCAAVQQGSFSGMVNITSNAPTGAQTATVQLTCSAPPNPDPGPNPNPGAYNIDIRPLGEGFTPARQAVFEQAAARWASIITGDLVDTPIQHNANQACAYGEPAFNSTVDDLMIYASITNIDGPGGILGQAGPAALRSGDQLTFVGCMQFDVNDVAELEASGTFDEVVLHEMAHVLGIGTLWRPIPPFNSRDLLSYTSNPPGQECNKSTAFSQIPSFTGTNAVAEFAALGRSGNVPVEDKGGQGTQCGHWDEEYFSTELMTGFKGPGGNLPLSRMTIASLKDLGYQVDMNQAEAYSIPACSPNCARLQSELKPIREVLLSPKFTVSPSGELIPLPGQ